MSKRRPPAADYRQTVEQMVRAAFDLTDRDRVATLEQAAAVADAHRDTLLGYQVPLEVMSTAPMT